MMNIKAKQIVLVIIVGLVFPFIHFYDFSADPKKAIDPILPRTSAGYFENFIHIDGSIPNNWSDTLANPWCSFENGFYIIENVTIDASDSPFGSGILINNSLNDKFIIRNCTIFNADHSFFDSGIWLENTHNGTIYDNDCSNNHQGIYLINSEGINITENTVNGNQYNGIYLDTTCNDNNITKNTVNNNLFGIQLVTGCDDNRIELNTVNFNEDYGIFINSFGASCDNNLILENTANENGKYGIFMQYTNHQNFIINNTANNNVRYGIVSQNSLDLDVHGNIMNNNRIGIYMLDSHNCNITENTMDDNYEIGFYLYYNSDNNLVKNNTINYNDLGIGLYQSDLNNITGNTLIGNSWCIFETDSVGNIIEYNDCSIPTVDLPIFIDGTATGLDAHNWTWVQQQSWFGGGLGTEGAPYVIENLRISGFGIDNLNGIEVINSNVYFIIQGCEIYNSESGIYLQAVNNSQLIDNNCSNNQNYGISVEEGSCYNEIVENTCNNNHNGIGLYLNSSYNHVTDNTLINNREGILIENDCNYTAVSGNYIHDNTGSGIYLHQSGYNSITENSVIGNVNNGIFLEEECDHNVISQNEFTFNNLGIELYYSDFNNINNNLVNNNTYSGIEIEAGSNNTITNNFIVSNIMFGIYIETDSNSNLIYKNYFLQNGLHAYDDGSFNKWNSSVIGNYWDNHTGPDANNDGIVDVPYTYIGGSAGSIDYLPIAPSKPGGLDPVIIILIIVISVVGGLVVVVFILNKQGKISLEKFKKVSFKRE